MKYFASLETIARWAVYLLFALAPFFFVPVPWMSIAQSKILLVTVSVVIGFLAWIAHSLNTSVLRFPKSPLLIASALIPIAYLVSALVTGASWASFVGDGRGQDTVMWFTLLYLAFLISADLLGGSGRSTPVLRLFLLGGLVVLLVQIFHLFVPAFTFGGVLTAAATSIVGSWHDLGIFLGLALFLSLALFRTPVIQGYWKFIAALIALSGAALLVVINFGDVWLGLLGLGIFYVFFLYRSRPLGSNIFKTPGFVLWSLCAAIALGMYFGGDAIHARLPAPLQVVQFEVRPSWMGTLAIGREVFAEPTQIFFGSGPNTFPREWGMYKPVSVNSTQFWNVDFNYGVGFIPTSVVTTGIAGLVAWGAICLALLWGLWRWIREVPARTSARSALLGSAVYLTVFHILYVPGPALSLLTFLVFGALVAEELSEGAIREWVVSLAWTTWRGMIVAVALLLFGLVVLFGGVQSVRALVSDFLVSRAVVEYEQNQDIGKTSRSISRALGVLPQNDRAHRAGVELGLMQLSRLAGEADTSDAARAQLQETLSATIQHGLDAVSIQNRDYQNWLTLARLYGELAGVGVEGAEKSARDAYIETRKNNPTSPLPYLGLAQLDLLKGDDSAARENLEAALGIKPNLVAAHFLLSQIYARGGDLGKAQEHAETVVQIAPQDPLGWYSLGAIFYAEENYEDAARAFEQAVQIRNDYANALYLLGLSYYRLDRKDDALKALGAVAAANPNDAMLKEAIERVEANETISPSLP